jgi:hypothetical protein
MIPFVHLSKTEIKYFFYEKKLHANMIEVGGLASKLRRSR